MKEAWLVLLDQFKNFRVINRLAKYDEKSTFQAHFLGAIWQILDPAINIAIYWFVFGIVLYGGRLMDGYSYIAWLLPGFIAWQFMRSEILGASRSMVQRVAMVSKMQFPVSTIPTMTLFNQLINYWWMLGLSLAVMLYYGVRPSVSWIQFIYFFICMIAFLYALGLLTSTITVVVRDFHTLLNSAMQLMFWISGTIFNFQANTVMSAHPMVMRIIEINPFYYVINGMREAFLGTGWFYHDIKGMVIFWSITLLIGIFGSHIHLKFRSRFVDYI
ncbi:ABC transporter permease [Lacticaseibacillus sharpeae]|uniref:Transport permease protein n=1 Tax=Lacticaseibacillus sharpeae JCM 1186 = DSM 20505 TaxID=1291052 RepID=A0A0R1ZKZ9_9LACO|nr:ABC transporter permease [Lacticaseibacillus sharpeae]KRM55066.1 ABC-2 type transporter [Lacticaseibacillus sharpeae JCM 1186 = DSM 20505]